MKLHELSSPKPSQQIIKVFESYFGNRIRFDRITPAQTKIMLIKIRGLLGEHRATSARHTSEKNPHYLQLVMMEQALTTKLQEVNAMPQPATETDETWKSLKKTKANLDAIRKEIEGTGKKLIVWHGEGDTLYRVVKQKKNVKEEVKQIATAPTGAGNKPTQTPDEGDDDVAKAAVAGVRKVASATGQGAQAGVLGKAIDQAVQGKPLDPRQRTALGTQLGGLQKAMSDPNTASRLQQMLQTAQKNTTAPAESAKPRRLREAGELQQAQVVLASQDMVDQIQKMIEQVSAMQFKDLPALVDSIRNEVGMEQAQQFNNDSTKTLQGLIQGLQGSKTQLESAQGVLTGQAPMVPGQDAGAAPVAPTTEPAAAADSSGAAPNVPAPVPAADSSGDTDTSPADTKALGRERR